MATIPPGASLVAFAERTRDELRARPRELPFERAEYDARLARLRRRMADDGIDVLILSAPDAMCWLHGYSARWYRQQSSTLAPPGQCTVVHVSDGMFMVEVAYHEELVRLTSCVEDVRPIRATDPNHEATLDGYVGFVVGELAAEGWLGGTVGFERWAHVPSPAVADVFEAALRERGCRIADATAGVREVRRLKSPAEIEKLERAQAAVDAGLLALQREVRPGTTELEAWSVYQSAAIAAGGEPAAIHETVSVGPMLPMAHALSTRRPIAAGEWLNADMATAFDHYHARGTRFVFVGDEPPAELVRLTEVAAGAFDVLRATARVGMPFRDLYRTLRAYYAESAPPELEAAASGYELGLSFPPDWVGEAMWNTEDEETDAVIEAGFATCWESVACAALVDTVVYEEAGARVLSNVPLEVLVAGAGA